MARHRSQAQFERARWRLRILAPAWLVTLALTIPLMGLFAWRLGDTLKHYKTREALGEKPTMEIAWEVANVFFSFLAAACTVFEMVRFWGEALTPWTMLFTHVIKWVCGAAILALDVVVLLQLDDRHYSIASIGVSGTFLILATGLLIWIIVVYRRVAIHGDYARRSNFKSYGFNDGLEPESGRNRASSIIDKHRLSFTSSRRVSMEQSTPYTGPTIQPASEMGPIQRTPSYYSHQRDTQFDEYMARRGSYNGTEMARRGSYTGKEVEAAMGNEFFGASNSTSSAHRGSSPSQQEEDIVLAAGSVSSRPSGVPERTVSTTSDHVLVSVPEEAHEGDEDGEDDSRALLGGQKRRRGSSDLGGPTRQSVDIVPKWQQQK